MGIADSGHYYSYINDREKKGDGKEEQWYEFNDTVVKNFDPKEIPNEAFGGEEKWRRYSSLPDSNIMSALKEKIRNAYLIIYDRVEPYQEKYDKDND